MIYTKPRFELLAVFGKDVITTSNSLTAIDDGMNISSKT